MWVIFYHISRRRVKSHRRYGRSARGSPEPSTAATRQPIRYGRSARAGCLPVIRCLADANPGEKSWCDIDYPRATGARRGARPNRRVLASLRLPHFRQHAALSLPCLGIYHWLRTRASPTPASQDHSSRATPRLPPSAIFIALLTRESPVNDSASLLVRLLNERRPRSGETSRLAGTNDSKSQQRKQNPRHFCRGLR